MSEVETVRRRRLSRRNLVLVVVGGLLVLAALKGLQWYDVDAGNNSAGGGFTFTDLRTNADTLDAAVARAYFDWLAWTLFVAGSVTALAANVPSPISDPLRLTAFLFGLLGAVGTYYAVAQLFNAQQAAGGSSHTVLHNASFGLWAALVGFVLITVGGALGPQKS